MVLASALVVASCADINVSRNASGVVPVGGAQTAQVSADDLVMALGRSGFTPEEILKHGPAIRNALAVRGGAEVREDGRVTAILSIVDGALYVVSQRGGTYVHELYA
jgi:hypothetical protein